MITPEPRPRTNVPSSNPKHEKLTVGAGIAKISQLKAKINSSKALSRSQKSAFEKTLEGFEMKLRNFEDRNQLIHNLESNEDKKIATGLTTIEETLNTLFKQQTQTTQPVPAPRNLTQPQKTQPTPAPRPEVKNLTDKIDHTISQLNALKFPKEKETEKRSIINSLKSAAEELKESSNEANRKNVGIALAKASEFVKTNKPVK